MNRDFVLMALLIPIVAIFLYLMYSFFLSNYLFPKKVVFPANGYYGSGNERKDNPSITPFRVEVSNASLQDLKARLEASRIGHQQLEDVSDFEYGMNLATVKSFKDHWLHKFDWRKQEALLNAFPQFTTEIEGLKVHFIHAKPPQSSNYKKVVPLLLVHGWPGNVFEFYKLIPMLVDPQNHLKGDFDWAFEVVAPSIPGYGWSEQPHKQGFSHLSAARVFNKLMVDRLHFAKYMGQGGDWGSVIVGNIGRMYPERLFGVHLNMVFGFPPLNGRSIFYSIVGSIAPYLVFSHSAEFANFNAKKAALDFARESGYFHLQATKPDTIGVGLNDSPIGLMTYILEKFSTWTDPQYVQLSDGGLEKKFTKDELLTIVSIYWFNQNILSSQRLYKEFLRPEHMELLNEYVKVPTGYAGFLHDLGERAPLQIARTMYNITQYSLFKEGGHFAAFEVPHLLAEDVLQLATKVFKN